MDGRSVEDRLAAAAARLDAVPAPAWRPDDRSAGHPAAIAGVVVEVSQKAGAGYQGADATVVTLQAAEGVEWAVWLFGKVLEDLATVQLGDVVAIRYEGMKQGRDAEYRNYRVVVDRAAAPAAAVQAEASAPAEPDRRPPAAEPPPAPAAAACERCGFLGGHHAEGCPNDIPF